jgi:anti-anti-sigma factor
MEITTRRSEDALELVIDGRLDAYWADHLAKALEEALRGGADRIRLNMAAVTYMSSVGIRVLLRFYKQLEGIRGSFAVVNPSEPVNTVLELAGLEALLITATASAAASVAAKGAARPFERGAAMFEVFDRAPGEKLRCTAIGDPSLLERGTFAEQHCRTVSFPENTIGVGVGAFGRAFDDCRSRFGEFLAAGGAAAYLPTDGTNVADYLVEREQFVPSVEVLYALTCTGDFAHLARFESAPGAAAVPLTTLIDAALDIANADAAGIVIVAESAGLVGAALRRSPALDRTAGTLFDHPGVRDWMSFTPERVYMRSLALIVGVATRAEHRALAPLVRPLGAAPWPAGHVHAAAFSYRPLQKRDLDLPTTVATLFEAETIQGVLHLLNDDRDIAGTGDSELVRGACWIGPISSIEATT